MIEQSRQLRQHYQSQLEQQSQITRKVMLRYYEHQLIQKPQLFKCVKTPNRSILSQSIKIPKVETSYRDYSELKQSLFSQENHYELEKLSSLLQIHKLKKITKGFHQVGRVLRFVQERMNTVQRNVFNEFIRNYNKQVQKQQYNKIANNLKAHIQHFLMKQILYIWSDIAKQKKAALSLIVKRNYFKKWRTSKVIPVQLTFFFKIWREYVKEKKSKRFHIFMRTQKLFQFWKLRTSYNKAKIRKEIIAKNQYENTLKQCVFGLLQQNIIQNRRNGNANENENEFLNFYD